MRRLGLALLLLGCAAPAYRFEEQEGVHDEPIEWWYHFGYLDGGRAWFSSFFRKRNEAGQVHRYMIYDLLDLKTGRSLYRSIIGAEAMPALRSYLQAARLARPNDAELKRWLELASRGELPPPHGIIEGPLAEKPGDPMALNYGPNRLSRAADGSYGLHIVDPEFSIDLSLTASAEPMYIGGSGLTGVDRPEDMHYYTLPRLQAAGTLRQNGTVERVQGDFWYDHQWGKVWGNGKVGWCWWGVTLDTGESINLYMLRDLKSGEPVRSVITSSRGRILTEAKFTSIDFWESPKTRVRYPVAWRIQADGLDLKIEPLFKERELDVLGDYRFIWEGPCRTNPPGRGFQELVGYPLEQKKP